MGKRVSLIVVEEGEVPIVPQLVPATIRWVEADRAYRTTFVITFFVTLQALALIFLRLSPMTTLWAVLFNCVGQTGIRAYIRYHSRRELADMREKLNR